MISDALKKELEMVFVEIQSYFEEKFLKGINAIRPNTVADLEKFTGRLKELGAMKLAGYVQDFIDKTRIIQEDPSEENYKVMIDSVLKILIYIRVYDRELTKEFILSKIGALEKSS